MLKGEKEEEKEYKEEEERDHIWPSKPKIVKT